MHLMFCCLPSSLHTAIPTPCFYGFWLGRFYIFVHFYELKHIYVCMCTCGWTCIGMLVTVPNGYGTSLTCACACTYIATVELLPEYSRSNYCCATYSMQKKGCHTIKTECCCNGPCSDSCNLMLGMLMHS